MGGISTTGRALPDDVDVVLTYGRIRGENWQALDLRLGDQQPIPWVAMDQRQAACVDGMNVRDWQHRESMSTQQTRQVRLWPTGKLKPADARLVRDLVQGAGTHERIRRRIGEEVSGLDAQARSARGHPPQQGVRIYQ